MPDQMPATYREASEVPLTRPTQHRLGYLVSRYPAVSHTFILREIAALRARGFHIEVASINDPPAIESMTETERSEAAATFYIKRAGPLGALRALVWALVYRTAGLARGLAAVFQLGGSDPRRLTLCLFYLIEAALLARWMARRGLRHLHVHFATPAATVAMMLCRMTATPFSITVHGPDEFYDVAGCYLAQKISAASFVVCISNFAQSQMMKLSRGSDWQKFEIARLGVDCDHFLPRPFRPAPAPFEILCVGRLVPAKGQRILIEAVAHLLAEGRELALRFIGDGPDAGELATLVRNLKLGHSVVFEGAVNQDAIRSFYATADLFVLASFAEGIPVVLMEAMAMEVPCIATAINGIPELIRDGIDGVLVAPSDVLGLATAIARFMEDPGLRESLGRAGRRRVQSAYEIGISADRLATVFGARLEPAR